MGILTEAMKQLVEEQRLGYVATACPDGTPNLSPKGTTAVWDDDHLIFGDICSPATVANLRTNPSVEINVVDVFARKGFRFKGHAEVVTEGPRWEQALAFYRERGTRTEIDGKRRINAAIFVRVEHARSLISPAYDLGEDEAQVIVRMRAYFDGVLARRNLPNA
jgi:predicted pyridoxine 5'-phosphate oxidase superfamily flavin-nucleotide-binding protein